MNYLEGLLLHEIILMVLGILLFLVLLVGMAAYIFRKEPIRKFLAFFPIPIVMIAYPSVEKVKFLNNLMELDKKIEQVINNPADSVAATELKNSLDKIEAYPNKTPETLTTLSKGHVILGELRTAERYVDSALAADPSLPKAREVKNIVQAEQNIEQIKKDSTNQEAQTQLKNNLEMLEQVATPSAFRTSKITEGYWILGDTAKVKTYADSTLQLQPDNIKANRIVKKMRNRLNNNR